MLFDHLTEKFNVKVNYNIVEANDEKRVGGRLFTHHFTEEEDHQYYDVGAMRFPKIDIMYMQPRSSVRDKC